MFQCKNNLKTYLNAVLEPASFIRCLQLGPSTGTIADSATKEEAVVWLDIMFISILREMLLPTTSRNMQGEPPKSLDLGQAVLLPLVSSEC